MSSTIDLAVNPLLLQEPPLVLPVVDGRLPVRQKVGYGLAWA